MKPFWQFFWQMLRHRGLMVVMFLGLILDTICFAGGLGGLTWIITQLFQMNMTMKQILLEKFQSEWVIYFIGDQTVLLQEYFPDDQLKGITLVMGIILVFAVVGSVGRFVHQYFAITLSYRTVMKVRKNAFQRLVHMPMSVVMDEGTSDKLSRVIRDCQQISRGLNAVIGKSVRSVVQGVVLLALAVLFDWQLAAIFLIGVPFIGVVLYRFGRSIRKATSKSLKQYGTMVAALQESLQAMRVVKVHQGEGYERRRFNRINRTVYSKEMRARFFRALTSPVVELIAMTGVMGVVLMAMSRVISGVNTSAELFSVIVMLLGAAAAFKPLGNLNNDIQEAAAGAGRVDEILKSSVEQNIRGGRDRHHRRLPRHCESIEFCELGFTYNQANRPALRDVNLKVLAGQVCAIVGGNGSGKSTLLGLLPRLYEPDQGQVLIDGVDVSICSLRSLRKQMAMVTQETVLFDGTIADNLIYGCRHVSEQQMLEASKRAHSHEFIMETPDGYDTEIGEFGSRLSGGQRQRIAIARAILRDPAILILDEATSQIDADSEARIAEALNEFMHGRTTFVIAHRLSTVVDADLIVVMEDGCIAATGKHADLLKTSDAYRVLCQTQLHSIES